MLRMEMEETLGNHALSKQNVEISMKSAKNIIKFNKCNQSNYKSSYKGHLRAHMKTHSEEKSSNVTMHPLMLTI